MTDFFLLLLISGAAFLIASSPECKGLMKLVSCAWGAFGAAFGPVVLFALFWKRSNKWGALAGMVAGGAMVFIWKFVIAKAGGVFAIYELLTAFIISSIFIVIISLIDKKPSTEIVNEFETVGK